MARTLEMRLSMTRALAIAAVAAAPVRSSGVGAAAPGQRRDGRASRPTFRAAVDLVSVAAVVRNKRGQVVRNLARDDFEVFDSGVRRPILEFSQGDNGPVSLAVLVDVSGSMGMASHLDGRAADAGHAAAAAAAGAGRGRAVQLRPRADGAPGVHEGPGGGPRTRRAGCRRSASRRSTTRSPKPPGGLRRATTSGARSSCSPMASTTRAG